MNDARPAPWIGVNFWSRSGGPRMWSRYDERLVRGELAVLARYGCNITRSFLYWPEFVPVEGTLDEHLMERLGDFLDAHLEVGMRTIPTFLVGHMSGQNWDPPWRGGRDLYRDVTFVAEQARYVEAVVTRVGRHEAIAGWLISNEMPLYGGAARDEDIVAWARLLVQAVRAGGGTQPVSLGDGAWGIEVSGHPNGYSLRALAPLVDFVGPHIYPMEDDELRQLLRAAFACDLAGDFGRPVVLEEFGATSDFASDENAAAYYRHVLWSTALAGATGWISWNNTDYDDLYLEDPYRHHPFEMHFGVTDRSGRPKPQLEEIRSFAVAIGRLGALGFGLPEADTLLVVPEHFEKEIPFTSPAFREDIRACLFQSYVAAREADLTVTTARERDGIRPGGKLYLLPSCKLLSAPGLRRLYELAAAGAVVYASFFAGSTPEQRGPWLTWLDDLFGVRHRLRYGLVEAIEDDTVTLELTRPLGDLGTGTMLRFVAAGTPNGRAYLPVEPNGGEVIARDGHGRPGLIRHRVGRGEVLFATYPLEYMAANRSNANPEDTWRLYSALGTVAGALRPAAVAEPHILVGRFIRGPETCLVVANASPFPARAELGCAAGDRGRMGVPGSGGEPVTAVELAAYGVELVTLEHVDERQ